MTDRILFFLLLAGIVVKTTTAAVYSVGPSQTYATIGEALDAAGDLEPGDVVEIHAKSTAYFEKFVINNSGTAANPIIIRGVPDGDGNLPLLDGNGAATPASQNYFNEPRSLIKVGGANTPSEGAAYVRIEYLFLQNAHPDYTFTDDGGSTQTYADNAACIHVEEGVNIEVVGNTLTACGNGIFVTPGVKDLLIEANYIYGNGNVGSIFEHNTYTEALGITYRFNRFGPLCNGCDGNNLKDRSGGLVVEYNLIQDGNRQLDLVDSDDAEILNDARYHETFVYGNILVEGDGEGNRQIVNYGGDSGTEANYRMGTLHFYHNTVVSTRVGRTTFVRMASEAESCDARNNIIYVTDSGDQLELLAENQGSLTLRSNWIKTGYVDSFESTGSGSVTEIDTIAGNSTPSFSDADHLTSLDFSLAESLLPNADLASGVPAVTQEYALHTSGQDRGNADIGAYGFGTSSDSGSSCSCFSSANTVFVKDRGIVGLETLKIGEYVLAGHGYSRVISLAHKDRNSKILYLQLYVKGLTPPLEISPDHIVFANGHAVRAGSVMVGDLLGAGEVADIKTVYRSGLFAPITESGDLLVSDVLASAYVAPLGYSSAFQNVVAHAIFAPHRLLCKLDFDICANESYTNGLSDFTTYPLLAVISKLSKWSVLVQLAVTLLATPFILAVYTFEQVFLSPALGMVVFVLIGFVFRGTRFAKRIHFEIASQCKLCVDPHAKRE